jgi:hypothetical protein
VTVDEHAGTPRVLRVGSEAVVPHEQVLEWELLAARRLIRLLRGSLGAAGMLAAVEAQTEESTRRLADLLDRSDGRWRRASVRVEINGLSTAEFFAWWAQTAATAPELFIDANAEHVAHVVTGTSRPGIVEPLGGLQTALFFRFAAGQGIEPVDPSYPHSVIGGGRLGSPEGPVAVRCIHHFRDLRDDQGKGMEALLTLEVPGAADDQLVEQARQHLAVEFSRFMAMARAGVVALPPPGALA